MILLAPPWCKNSKNVIRFKIGIWEGGEKIGHTDAQTDFREFLYSIDFESSLKILHFLHLR